MGDSQFYVRSRGRVSGPFDRDTLNKMLRRGIVSRVDEISADRSTWQTLPEYVARDLVNDSGSHSNVPKSATSEGAGGYFYSQAGAKVGPVPSALLVRLVGLGKISPDAIVWTDETNQTRASDVDWLAPLFPRARQDALVADRSIGCNVIAGIAVAALVLIFGVALAAFLITDESSSSAKNSVIGSTSTAAATSVGNSVDRQDGAMLPKVVARPDPLNPSSIFEPGVVKGAQDEQDISSAIGLVVAGFEFSVPEINGGRRTQLPMVTGSCFTITPYSDMLTNRHVVEMIEKARTDPVVRKFCRERLGDDMQPMIWVFVAGSQYTANVTHISSNFDLAVLKVQGVPPVVFRLSANPKETRGQDVYALGFPGIAAEPLSVDELTQAKLAELSHEPQLRSNFKERDFQYSLTKGVLSRMVQEANGHWWIQHEATVRHGNSGGPLVDGRGVVLGINTQIQKNEEGDVQTNISSEISQMRSEIEQNTSGSVWISTN